MKTIFCYFITFPYIGSAQNIVGGGVVPERGEPLPGVNIFIVGNYAGASSNADGNFGFTTSETGRKS